MAAKQLNIAPIDRISLADARYIYGRHVLDLVKVEPVAIWRDHKPYWLCWFNGMYILEPFARLYQYRADGTGRPIVSPEGVLHNSNPLKLVA